MLLEKLIIWAILVLLAGTCVRLLLADARAIDSDAPGPSHMLQFQHLVVDDRSVVAIKALTGEDDDYGPRLVIYYQPKENRMSDVVTYESVEELEDAYSDYLEQIGALVMGPAVDFELKAPTPNPPGPTGVTL